MDTDDFPIVSVSDDDVNDQDQDMNKFLSLSICLKPKDDLPHPRYLCFRYPFGKTSSKRHCKKCFCYVCDELAPCKKWNKPPQGHCHATGNDEKWRLERQLIRKKLPANTLIMAHHKLTVTLNPFPPGQQVLGCGGAMITDGYGDWVTAVAMRIDSVEIQHLDVLLYTILLEGLHHAWSRGYRCLEVRLGFRFRNFWFNFIKDPVTKKIRLRRVDPYWAANHRTWTLLKDIHDYLNKEWFIHVKSCPSYKEECPAVSMAGTALLQEQDTQVYDFPTHPQTEEIMKGARAAESAPTDYIDSYNFSKEEWEYCGFA